jgi:hypothetical protein
MKRTEIEMMDEIKESTEHGDNAEFDGIPEVEMRNKSSDSENKVRIVCA